MALYGFNQERAKALTRLADHQGMRRRGKSSYTPPALLPQDLRLVRFVNSEDGVTVPAYGVMAPGAATVIDGVSHVTTTRPGTAYHRRWLVNTGTEVAYNTPGIGVWLDQAWRVAYDSSEGTPAITDGEWGPVSGSYLLGINRPNFIISGDVDTTDPANPFVVAVQKFTDTVLGKADAAIANAASGTVRVYIGTPGSETDSGQTISSAFNKGPDIDDEAWVTVSWPHGKPYVWLANCP